MTEGKGQEIVIIATMVTLGSTTSAYLKKPNEQSQKLQIHRTIIGGFAAMFGSSLLVELKPEIGAYLAIAVSGVAFFRWGLPTIEALAKTKEETEKEERSKHKRPTVVPQLTPIPNPKVQLV